MSRKLSTAFIIVMGLLIVIKNRKNSYSNLDIRMGWMQIAFSNAKVSGIQHMYLKNVVNDQAPDIKFVITPTTLKNETLNS